MSTQHLPTRLLQASWTQDGPNSTLHLSPQRLACPRFSREADSCPRSFLLLAPQEHLVAKPVGCASSRAPRPPLLAAESRPLPSPPPPHTGHDPTASSPPFLSSLYQLLLTLSRPFLWPQIKPQTLSLSHKAPQVGSPRLHPGASPSSPHSSHSSSSISCFSIY